MATWRAFAAADSELAAAGESLFRAFTVGYLATLRAGGAPRIHPVTVTLHDGGLFISTIGRSRKSADLRRDPRFALHAWPRPWSDERWDDDEFTVHGQAVEVTDPGRKAAVLAVHNDATGPDDPLWELHLEGAFHKHRPGGKLQERSWRA